MPADRRAARRGALLGLLEEEALDGLVVSHLPNIRYLTGFTGTAGLAVVLREETLFLSDFRYRTQAEEEIGALARVEIVPSDLWERLPKLLAQYAGLETLGFESHAVTAKEAEQIATLSPRLRFQGASGLVERLRERKDAGEVGAIREAAALAAAALDAVLPTLRVGQREIDVAASLEHELRRRGSEWHPFRTIVASGPRAALPHAGTTVREIRKGDWLLIDFGAQVDGYCADLTRTLVLGAPADERQRMIYDLVREAQHSARERVRAGMPGRDADAIARSIIEARGFGDAFGHSLGHGLGLEVHEAPRLSKLNEGPLPEGAVVTIEPGIYLPGWGGVRIEDDVHLGPEGPDLLSDGLTELRELP